MLREIRPAIVVLLLLTLITCVAYPLAMTGIAETIFPYQAQGSLIEKDGKVIGSALIGQNFASAKYFHGRPSATTEPDPKDPSKTVPVPYAADNSGGSNLGPTSKALIDRITADAAKMGPGPVPSDAVTTSASGLDPDITPANALLQVAHVAQARHLPADRVRALVEVQTRRPLLGFLGQPRVNVLALNMALDKLPVQ